LRKNFIFPGALAIITGISLISFGMKHVYATLFFTFSVFVTVTILMEFYRGIRARKKLAGEGVLKALGSLLWKNKRRYGGYVIHLGLIMVFVGVTGSSAFTVEETQTLGVGEGMKLRDYTLRYEGISYRRESNFDAAAAKLTVFKDGKLHGIIQPEKRRYDKYAEEPSSEVALDRSLKEDLFVILASIHEDDRVTIRAIINPLINWYWMGGIVAFFGGLYVLLPEYKRKEEAEAS
ncbi:MAG: cytochrome c-type biogenesis CcmF C-terminal domain-containing protein, partial [Deltaproteobacteria bacterium]